MTSAGFLRVLGAVLLLPGALTAQSSASGETAAAHLADPLQADATPLAGAVSFPYGRSHPELWCAPLRTCKVLLAADEVFLAKASGDTERWSVGPMAGPGGATIVVVKPHACGIATDLTLATDRRVYELRLRSPECGPGEPDARLRHTSLVRFHYPDETAAEYAAVPAARMREEGAAFPVESRAADLSVLDFAYEWRRDRGFPWLPEQVFDDGARTHVRVPPEAARHDLPVLFELGADGSMRVVNYVVRGGMQEYFVVDRVLERAVFVTGTGRRGQALRLLVSKREERR